MKAISELAELWGGLPLSSIWAPGRPACLPACPPRLPAQSLALPETAQMGRAGWGPAEEPGPRCTAALSTVQRRVNCLAGGATKSYRMGGVFWWPTSSEKQIYNDICRKHELLYLLKMNKSISTKYQSLKPYNLFGLIWVTPEIEAF